MVEGCYVSSATNVTKDLFTASSDLSLPKEGYRISISEKGGISVSCSDNAGAFYALQTLRQLSVPANGRLVFPCCEIKDFPRFGWRGVQLDDSRHFFGKAAVKRIIDQMSAHKLNVFHWHLTDNGGWRLPVPKYPKLTTVAATRRFSKDHKVVADRFEDGVYGPFSYTRDEIAEVIAYAKERFVRVVPEVDMPGHSIALIRAYPEFGCVGSRGGAELCVGDDHVLDMVKDVLDEVVELFPDEVVHIGGDEVIMDNWKSCPKCQARMKEHCLKTEKDLLAWFVGEVAAHLKRRGRRAVWWSEIPLDGNVPGDGIVMAWRDAQEGRDAVAAGHEAIMCPHKSCYFDYTPCLRDDFAPYPWFTHPLPLEKAYAYDPVDGIPAERQRLVLGGQCCNWTEYTCNETELQWKMWPRTCATAEVFWSTAEKRDFADFRRRMETHRHRLIESGVNCAPLE